MAQGKFKNNNKNKGKTSDNKISKQKKKGNQFTRRPNAPMQPKKSKFDERKKIKQILTKSVNKSVEDEMRQRSTEGQIKLSKAQEAVAKFHNKKTTDEETHTPAVTE